MAQCLSPQGCRGKAGEPDHRALARGQVAAGGSVAVELPVVNKAHLCPDPCPCLSLGQGLTQQREREREGKWGQDWYWGRQERSPEGQENE